MSYIISHGDGSRRQTARSLDAAIGLARRAVLARVGEGIARSHAWVHGDGPDPVATVCAGRDGTARVSRVGGES